MIELIKEIMRLKKGKTLAGHFNALGFALVIFLMGVFFTEKSIAQCAANNNGQYPTATINAGTGALVQITNQQYEGDYTQINGIINGAQYRFTINVASDIITVRVGSRTGAVLGFGSGSVIVTATSASNLFVHWNTSTCGTANTNRTTTVQGIPTITNISAAGCPGGTFDITGIFLNTVTSVSVNGTNSPIFNINSATSITVTIPANASSGNVSVTSSGGTGVSGSPITIASPAAPNAINDSRCGVGTINIAATPGTGETIDWYADPSGGSILPGGMGTTDFTTSISGTVTYYAQARNTTTGCLSASRTAVTAIVNPTPVASAASTNITCNSANDGTITVTANGGAGPYMFSVDDGTNYQAATGIDLSLFTGLLPNTPYRIKVKDNNGCISK